MATKITEDVQRLLKTIVDHFDKEDTAVRERQIRTWRRLKLFWDNFHRTWYSEVAHDWRIWDETTDNDSDQGYYDKPVNIFRAYLESIIAALSVTVPPIKCYPDDADSTLDLSTAKAGDKAAQLVFRHNNAPLLWLHMLFIYCTEGMLACYSYPKEDEKYGTYDKKEYAEEEEEHTLTKCPNCGFTISDEMVPPQVLQVQSDKPDEFMPYEEEAETIDYGSEMCPSCGSIMTPQVSTESFIITRMVGITKEAKTRICLETYGGLYVKVSNYARNQQDCLYLNFSYECHYAAAIERFEHLHGNSKLTAQKIRGSSGPRDPYEEWGRLSPQYQGEYPLNVVTMRNWWFRPSAFNVLPNQEDVKKLKKLFPNGCKVVFVNDEFGDACQEMMDDCWTLSYNPLADYIHFDPLGLLLVSIQEIINDLISLIVQTIEHGIGQSFADPGVLNFDAYRQMESIPGGIYEAKPLTGKTVADAFHQIKTASLSPEVMTFANMLQQLAQLVSGALPSLFGGQLQGSETASEYSMSRNQALQRQGNTWKMLLFFWKDIFGKVIPMYLKEIKDDERNVERDKDGNFINVFIRRAELEGKIGRIELEANENLPITWSQQRDIVMQLLQAANPEILAILGDPDNLPRIREAIGLTDFIVPGEDDRNKQYDEIKELLNSEPIVFPDPKMGEIELPSVEVDPEFDDHEIEFRICREWIISEAGRLAKIENPNGYKNVLLHGRMHLQQMQMQQQAAAGKGTVPTEKPNELEAQEVPIQGDGNVPTVA